MVLSKSHSPVAFDELLDLQVLIPVILVVREKCLAFRLEFICRRSILYNNFRFLAGVYKYPGSLKRARRQSLSLL
jgi:hypothetical protein